MQQILDVDDPVAVLLSDTRQGGEGWLRVVGHPCGGFSCDSYDGFAYVLPVLSERVRLIETIANQEFSKSETLLDYGATEEDKQAYREFLSLHGLTISDDILRTLTQAIYAMDATDANYFALTGIAHLPIFSAGGIRIAVLGDNCD